MENSGRIFYQDSYGVIYETEWETINLVDQTLKDVTTIIKDPRTPGQQDTGEINNKKVYRNGICTVTRQIIEITDSSYTVIAEGSSQYPCTFQATFYCENKPTDNFKYHLNFISNADSEIDVTSGPRFTSEDDTSLIFPDILPDGTLDLVSTYELFDFVDVW